MSSSIVVARHATAQRISRNGGDRGRELTLDGVSQAGRLGALIAASGLAHVDEMYVSPATRTQQTAEQILRSVTATTIETNDRIYGGGVDALWEIIRCSGGKSVMLVGHEPTASIVATMLAQEPTTTQQLPFYGGMPTASAVILSSPTELSKLGMNSCTLADFVHAPIA